jgi:hypothetical protein
MTGDREFGRFSANRLFLLALCAVMLWPPGAAAQLDGTSFGPETGYPSSALYSFAIAVGDLNGDGFVDLVLTDQCGQTGGSCSDPNDRNTGIQVLINNGNGTFHSGHRYTTDGGASSWQSAAIADLDRDGKQDVVVINAGPPSISVLRGNGDGTLQAAVSYPLNIYLDQNIAVSPNRIAIADLNGDGWPDVVISVGITYQTKQYPNEFRSGVMILLNQGDGTLAITHLYETGGYLGTAGVVTADLNGDGIPDTVVVNSCGTYAPSPANGSPCQDSSAGLMPGSIGVLLGNGDGSFQPAVDYPSGGYSSVSVAVADLDGDGNPDLLIANGCSNPFCNSGVSAGKASVLIGKGDGTFQDAVNYDDGAVQPVSVAAVDADGDGNPDAFVLNNCTALQSCDGLTPQASAMLGNGNGTLHTPAALFGAGGYAHTILMADVDNDGKPDLLVGNWAGMSVRLNKTPRAVTTTTLHSDPNPSAHGHAAIFMATISSAAAGTPTGTVKFREGKTTLGSATLVNGVATLPLSSLSLGSHSIVASYSSDAAFRVSTSAPLTHVVKIGTTTALSSSANPSLEQKSVTFTATVTTEAGNVIGLASIGSRTALSGTVSFTADAVPISGCTDLAFDGGTADAPTASCSTAALPMGVHAIVAAYSGDASYLYSLNTLAQQVKCNGLNRPLLFCNK